MSDLVGNPEDRFSRVEAHITLILTFRSGLFCSNVVFKFYVQVSTSVVIWKDHEVSYKDRIELALDCHKGARWRSGRASDSKSRGPGFDPHRLHCVVSLSKTQLPTVLVKPRTSWLRPDMTEKLLTGTLSRNTNDIDCNKESDLSPKRVSMWPHKIDFSPPVHSLLRSLPGTVVMSPCQPVVAGSIPDLSSLTDENINRGPVSI